MATGVQNINLSNYDAVSSDIPRQLRLAQALQEQANAPIEVQSYKGIQAPIPWTAVLAKVLKSYVGTSKERKAEENKVALKNFESSELAKAMEQEYSPVTIPGKEQIPEGDGSPAPGTDLGGVQEAPPAQPAQQPAMPPVATPAVDPLANPAGPQNVASGQRIAAALGGNAPSFRMDPQAAAPSFRMDPQAAAPSFRVAPDMAPPGMAPPGVAPGMAPPGMAPPGVAPQAPGMAPMGAMAPMPPKVVEPTSRAPTGAEMMSRAIALANHPMPEVRAIGVQLMEKANKEIGREKMVNAIKSVNIGDADPAIMSLYMSSDNPAAAIDYLVKSGIAKAEAAATVAEIQLRANEAAEQRELDRKSQEAIAAQASADRKAIADQASEDRRLGYNISAANSAASRDLTRSLAQQRVAPVPANIRSGYFANNASINQIDDAIKAINENRGHLGLLNAMGDEANQRRDPKGVSVRAMISNFTSLVRHDRSGVAVTYVETPYLKPFLPSVTDNDNTAIEKLNQLKKAFQNSNGEMETEFNFSSPSAGQSDPLGLR